MRHRTVALSTALLALASLAGACALSDQPDTTRIVATPQGSVELIVGAVVPDNAGGDASRHNPANLGGTA